MTTSATGNEAGPAARAAQAEHAAEHAAEHTTEQGTDTSAGRRLRELYTQEWEWRKGQLGTGWSGAVEVQDFLPAVGRDAQDARQRRWEQTLEDLHGIPREDLAPAERTTYDVYESQLRTLIDAQRFRVYERPATADSAFWRNLAFTAMRLSFADAEEAESYLRQLSQMPRFVDEHIANMAAGVARGFGPARVCMTGREEPVRVVAQETDATRLAFYRPFRDLPGGIDGALAEDLRARACDVLREAVIPAYARLHDFLVTEYLPELPESIATLDQPDGAEFYAAQLREYTTTDLAPEDIHRLGLEEVAKIRAEMEQVAAEVGFASDVDGLLDFMRTDPQFYATTPRQLVAEAAYTAKAFDGVVHSYFGRLPQQRFSIMQTPAEIAAFDTFGRGAPDKYILNTYNLPARPLYSLPALTLHESAPGHSFQLSLARELDLPEFRRQYISAFGEGWGLYTERLGQEMGLYETPYERMGMLSFQMWRAVRLVVDPGMHALGWSREQAQDFLREHTAISEHEIVTEIDRYISWPGQACSYYLGQLEIQRIRARAEEALGAGFDIRAFHDALLGMGSVPLSVLGAEMERFIAASEEAAVR